MLKIFTKIIINYLLIKFFFNITVKKLKDFPASWYQHSIWKWDTEINPRRRRRHISMVDQTWQCPDCGRCYIYQRGLNLHRRFECGKEPMFKCPFCPKKCHQPGNLTVHIRNKHSKIDKEKEIIKKENL